MDTVTVGQGNRLYRTLTLDIASDFKSIFFGSFSPFSGYEDVDGDLAPLPSAPVCVSLPPNLKSDSDEGFVCDDDTGSTETTEDSSGSAAGDTDGARTRRRTARSKSAEGTTIHGEQRGNGKGRERNLRPASN